MAREVLPLPACQDPALVHLAGECAVVQNNVSMLTLP